MNVYSTKGYITRNTPNTNDELLYCYSLFGSKSSNHKKVNYKYLIPRKKCSVLRSNLMRLYSPVDLTDNLIMIEKLVGLEPGTSRSSAPTRWPQDKLSSNHPCMLWKREVHKMIRWCRLSMYAIVSYTDVVMIKTWNRIHPLNEIAICSLLDFLEGASPPGPGMNWIFIQFEIECSMSLSIYKLVMEARLQYWHWIFQLMLLIIFLLTQQTSLSNVSQKIRLRSGFHTDDHSRIICSIVQSPR